MKSFWITFFFSCQILVSIAQIPNGNFEQWETLDSIENPVHWATNNYYVGYKPVMKEEAAISGLYSMKISSTARDVFGTATLPGCAHVKLMPTQLYLFLTASIRIDSIDQGEITLRVKQRRPDGFYEKIGDWKSSTVTAGVQQITMPIAQTLLDTLLIEVWAFNTEIVLGNVGYSEAILDDLSLKTSVGIHETPVTNDLHWKIWPNPARDFITILPDRIWTAPCQVSIIDQQGKLRQEHEFQNFSDMTIGVQHLEAGIYLLEIRIAGSVFPHKNIVIIK